MNTKKLDFGDVWARVKSALSGKVDKVNGKGLSSNDYTNEDKQKVEAISTITDTQINKLFN